jgi:hypothetical protein
MSKLPERINVSKTITYDVPRIVNDLKELGLVDEITTEILLDYIEDWVAEDFGTEHTLIYQDENGEEL